jgi:soluble cytochrome b562
MPLDAPSNEVIKYLKDNSNFQEFMVWVLENIEALDTVDDLSKLSNERAGEEVKVRIKAVDTVRNIFHPFLTYHQKREPTEKEYLDAHKRVGL